MSHQQGDGVDEIEIVDSGHQASTERTEAGVEEFWAIVKNSRDEATVTVELQLHDEDDVLARYDRSQSVGAGDSERYRFGISVPRRFDEYVFAIDVQDGK